MGGGEIMVHRGVHGAGFIEGGGGAKGTWGMGTKLLRYFMFTFWCKITNTMTMIKEKG